MTSIIKVDTIQDTSGNNIINENSNTITIGASGDTTNIIGTLQNDGAAVGGTTSPYCSVYRNGDQTLSDNTWTKIQYNVENVDSAGAFDSSTNYRFTPQTSGYYFVSCNGTCGNTSDNSIDSFKLKLYKNGSEITSTQSRRDWDVTGINFNDSLHTSVIVQMNGSSDYIEAYMLVNVTGGTPRVESQKNSMQIFKMTE